MASPSKGIILLGHTTAALLGDPYIVLYMLYIGARASGHL